MGWFFLLLLPLFLGAKGGVDFAYQVHLDGRDTVSYSKFGTLTFEDSPNLNLGFYAGSIWIKGRLTNLGPQGAFILHTQDFINRNYRFYEIKDGALVNISPEALDQGQSDDRYFNFREPNFRIDLAENETKEFLLHTFSDGRICNATPAITPLDDFVMAMRRLAIFNVSFFGIVGALFLSILLLALTQSNKTYLFYSGYILFNTFFMLGLDGSFFDLGIDNYLVDHLIFFSVRILMLSFLAFSALFLGVNKSAPRFFYFAKIYVFVVMLGLSIYEVVFYHSSVAVLHRLENMVGFSWYILVIAGVILAPRGRLRERFIYLVFLAIYIGTTILSLTTSHGGNGLISLSSLYKLGSLVDFIGFTIVMVVLVRKRKQESYRELDTLKKINSKMKAGLEQKNDRLNELEAQLRASDSAEDQPNALPSFDITQQLAIFKLIEANISSDEEWGHFQEEYLRLDPQFLPKLLRDNPSLSKSEIRLLVLLKIGYAQKEVAQMLAISPDSVKKARQRTRKKLGLDSDMAIQDYLNSL